MMTSSNGSIFRVTGHLCGEFTGPRWIPRKKASNAELSCFFDLHPNKRLSKQWQGWWFEKPSCPLWRHRNGCIKLWVLDWYQVFLFANSIHSVPIFPPKYPYFAIFMKHIHGLVQDCSNSIANTLELLQSCTNPAIKFGDYSCSKIANNRIGRRRLWNRRHKLVEHNLFFEWWSELETVVRSESMFRVYIYSKPVT